MKRDSNIKMLIMENYIMETLDKLDKKNPTIFIIDNPQLTNSKTILDEYPQAIIHAICRYDPFSAEFIIKKTIDTKNGVLSITFYNMLSVNVLEKFIADKIDIVFDLVYLDGEQHAHSTVKNLFPIKTLIRPHTMIFMVYSHRTRLSKGDVLPNGKKIRKPTVQLKPMLKSLSFKVRTNYPNIYKDFHKHSRCGKGRSMNLITISSR